MYSCHHKMEKPGKLFVLQIFTGRISLSKSQINRRMFFKLQLNISSWIKNLCQLR